MHQRFRLRHHGFRAALATLFFVLLFTVSPASAQVVTFTQIPSCGTQTNLEGTVTGIGDAALFEIAVYINAGGNWWTKPTFTNPTFSLTPAGPGAATFSGDFVSHPNDMEAGYIVAFLVPAGITPPVASGAAFLPLSLFSNPYATATRECATRVIEAWNRAWLVKESGGGFVGPGPNIFSNNSQNVYVDGSGLHLRITHRMGKWQCAEVIDITADPATSSPGYGTYLFQVQGDMDLLDPNVILGLFTWDTFAPGFNYREIDFEAARWGNGADPTNAQFAVQPWSTGGNLVRFTIPPGETAVTHTFDWQASTVDFKSWSGTALTPPATLMAEYNYTGGDVPPEGFETCNTRMNLWLNSGSAPEDNNEVEVVISYFTHNNNAIIGVGTNTPAQPVPITLRAFPSPGAGPVRVRVQSGTERHWDISIVNARGGLVRNLAAAMKIEGAVDIQWNGRDERGRTAGPGIYFAVARAQDMQAATKIVRLR